LFDVSVVTHPAYSSSSAAVARRSMEAWMAEQEEAPVQAGPVSDGKALTNLAVRMAARLRAAKLRSHLRG